MAASPPSSRAAAVVLAATAGVAALASAAALIVSSRMANAVVTPTLRHPDDVEVAFDLDALTVTLSKTADSGIPGRYGLWFSNDTGFAVIGEILHSDDHEVVRVVEELRFGDTAAAFTGRLTGWVQLSPDELEIPVESVAIPTDGGEAPAWFFPAPEDSGLWAIHSHGRGVRRQEALRAVPVFAARGYTNLVVSWRNDGDAPPSADRRYALGATEWRDLDSAIAWALDHGARRIVLVGFSMGGSISLQTSVRSEHRHAIAGLVLDSPVVDWMETLLFQADTLRVPDWVSAAALDIITSPVSRTITRQGAPLDFRQLDFVARAGELTVPTLLLHSDDDGIIPSAASRALGHARPDLVEFVAFDDAAHTRLWNFAPERWTSTVGAFLDRL